MLNTIDTSVLHLRKRDGHYYESKKQTGGELWFTQFSSKLTIFGRKIKIFAGVDNLPKIARIAVEHLQRKGMTLFFLYRNAYSLSDDIVSYFLDEILYDFAKWAGDKVISSREYNDIFFLTTFFSGFPRFRAIWKIIVAWIFVILGIFLVKMVLTTP